MTRPPLDFAGREGSPELKITHPDGTVEYLTSAEWRARRKAQAESGPKAARKA